MCQRRKDIDQPFVDVMLRDLLLQAGHVRPDILQTMGDRAVPGDGIPWVQEIAGVPLVGAESAIEPQMTCLPFLGAQGCPGYCPRRQLKQEQCERLR